MVTELFNPPVLKNTGRLIILHILKKFEATNMIRKEQLGGVKKGNIKN